MQAIITQIIPATDTLPKRVKASCERGKLVLAWDNEFSAERNHIEAAKALQAKFIKEDQPGILPHETSIWQGQLVSGWTTYFYCHIII